MKKQKNNPALEKAIKIKGSQLLLAGEIGCNQSTLSRALKSDLDPFLAPLIEKAVNGEVTRHQLCPEISKIFRE